MATPAQSRGLIGLIKLGIQRHPEIMGSSFMGLIGIGFMLTGAYIYYDRDLDNRKYKFAYTVIRDDDPKALRVRKD